MERMEFETLIARPINEVFTFLTDLENDPTWKSEFVDARRTTDGPIGVGTRFSLFSKTLGRRIETVFETTEYEPNESATWKTVSGPLSLTFRRTVEPVEGGTRVVAVYTGEFDGLVRLFRPLIVATGRRQNRKAFHALKPLLESRGS